MDSSGAVQIAQNTGSTMQTTKAEPLLEGRGWTVQKKVIRMDVGKALHFDRFWTQLSQEPVKMSEGEESGDGIGGHGAWVHTLLMISALILALLEDQKRTLL
ncbi:hypothetical protein DFH08DRAFT_935812 [Mycena albidolilacea]|uniref:Uncharacterized protein n=1 Tax=Mycena albidolilacea TaxID=1033008 RepID=A0AAD7EV18_9AGAR|nr:hypothetical protein DFH08DRAFT_935812 [Mycena albidolilacea]